MSMTRLERAAKAQIERVLNEQGYPTYSRLLDLFDVNLTAQPDVVGYMVPGKAKIVLNKNLNIDQVSTIVRHEILHEYLTHAQREARFKETDPKYKDLLHDIMNIAGDYEISNVGYTDSDKTIVRSIQLRDKVLRGLVTEDDHPDWEDKTFEEMLALLYDEYKDNQDALKQMLDRMGNQGDPSTEEAEDIERQAQIQSEQAEAAGDSESAKQADNIAKAASKVANDIEKSEQSGNTSDVFDSEQEQKEKEELADRVNKIKKAFNDLKQTQQIEDENREVKKKEIKAAKDKELDKYKHSPIIRFRESLNRFIKNEIEYNREASWRKYNKKYGDSDIVRPGRTNVASPIPLINVYFDRSGSWDAAKTAEGAKAISTLNKYVRTGKIKIKLYYFSNNVHSIERDAENEGGTEGQPILEHIEQTKPTNVIILTDSDIDDCTSTVVVPGGVWFLFYSAESQNLIDHLHGKALTRIFDMDF